MQNELPENNSPASEIPSDGATKKRGRKPKPVENDSTNRGNLPESPKRRRGRPPKNKAKTDESALAPADGKIQMDNGDRRDASGGGNGPEWRDFPESPDRSETSEDAGLHSGEIFQHAAGDDFAYGEPSKISGGDSEEIPTSFSTTDEDLNPEAYAAGYDSEGDADPSRGADADSKSVPQRNSLPQRQQRSPDKRGRWQQAPQNNRRQQNGRDRNNFKNAQPFRNPRGQQGNQRGQNTSQKLQQRGQQNQRQQVQQPQKQRKPHWMQNQSSENDAMNPADLPEWTALKTEKALDEFLARTFFGITPAQDAAEGQNVEPAGVGTPLPGNLTGEDGGHSAIPEEEDLGIAANKGEYGGAAENFRGENSATAAQNTETGEDGENCKIEPSYWAIMNGANKILAPEAKEQVAETESPEPNRPEASSDSQTDTAVGYAEPTAMELSCGKSIESTPGFDEFYRSGLRKMQEKLDELGVEYKKGSGKSELVGAFFKHAFSKSKLVRVKGVLDILGDGMGGAITFASDGYRLAKSAVYVPQLFIDKYFLKRGHILGALAMPPRADGRETCPVAVMVTSVMDGAPESAKDSVPFTELTPYYPTRRMIMEADAACGWDNLSMRAIDLLAPIGLGQRALIVAPPRTGKTVLMQGMAKSIRRNTPGAHLIVLLVDERPEEVTDFRRSVDAEVVASTFDEDASNHIHAAEMVISKARRMVEKGCDVVILLDSITRLARAYNAMMPNGGRTMSGGVEANALQKPKKFFGSARNIEGGGSLTIIGTALVETGSKMDEVIFEEFKGTGNLELHLDRSLSDKRIFPSINIEKSGTRKEELLYHPDEMSKIYALRRALKGVPATDAMEMLVQRLKKVKTNIEFLLGLNR